MASTFPRPDHERVGAFRLAVIAAAALCVAGGAGAAPPAFHLVFDGSHNAALLHQGTFMTSSAWCPSGTAADVSIEDATLTATRRFTCSGGGGEFTAIVRPLDAEHGGSGSWQIVSGSGALADLRGKGTFASTRLTGDPGNPASVTFRSTWDGVADLDAAGPTVAVTSSSVKKTGVKATYSVRVVLSLADSSGGPVTYTLEAATPSKPASPLVFKQATTSLATVTSSFRVKLPATTRRLRVKIGATDPLGNTSSVAATIRVR
jgi:hypothetical protein